MDTDDTRPGRPRRAREFLTEWAIAFGFIGSVLLADRLIVAGMASSLPAKGALMLAPVLALCLWLAFHFRRIRRLDELQRAIETQALAAALSALVWLTTVWGLAVVLLDAPSPPLILIAPAAAALYGVIRIAINKKFR